MVFSFQDDTALTVALNSIKLVKNPEELIPGLIPTNPKTGIFYIAAEITNSNNFFKWGTDSNREIIKGQMYFLKKETKIPTIRTYLFQMRTHKIALNANDVWFQANNDKVKVIVDGIELDQFDPKLPNVAFFNDYQVDLVSTLTLADKQLLIRRLNLALVGMNLMVDEQATNIETFPKQIRLTTKSIDQSFDFDVEFNPKASELNVIVKVDEQPLFKLDYELVIKNSNTLQLVNRNKHLGMYIWSVADQRYQAKLLDTLQLFLQSKQMYLKEKIPLKLQDNTATFKIAKQAQPNNGENKNTNFIGYLVIAASSLFLVVVAFSFYFYKRKKSLKSHKQKAVVKTDK
ncbi:hypothetical protein [Mycoplasmoides pneumoniae]|nr:hypothetical protein [Mycoplasmoides pneumoniae]ALA30481.1 hypothetical protein C897_03475 [Mycoplasmoides pneumoniae PI 1428]ALA30775.1 hypothetical protein B434_01130 [Mycoplasmoides pneumoniae 19294]ALA31878.1 hypothetical protein F536_03455 [Mycoplasmoides pneumoniae 39443]ALA32587.1 hypothetical protein F533_03475 [Mycoplasmoides pneumoniae 51494]ALA33288.1 hypothetical protein F530_03485 [Mycoplasmoides pneumoniae 54089]